MKKYAFQELKALETAEFDVGENQPEQIVQAYSAITGQILNYIIHVIN